MSIQTTLTKSEGMGLTGQTSGSSSTSIIQTFTVKTSLTTAIRGESAYESWLKIPGNQGKTLADFFLENGGKPKIKMGNVLQGAVASASFREVDGVHFLDLSLPRGSDGSSPTLSMGSVSAGQTPNASITGNFPLYKLNLILPQGQSGRDGKDGTNGIDGRTPTIEIGTVESTTGSASATLVKSAGESYNLNLKIPQGTKGINGTNGTDGRNAANPNIRIGDVVQNEVAGATITGSYPDLFINLSLPRGATGSDGKNGTNGIDGNKGADGKDGKNGTNGVDGKNPTIKIGTISTGTTSSASLTGTYPDYVLNLTLVKGDKGNDGVSPNLTIGNVQSGTSSSASIAGTFPDLKLNLTVQKGIDGTNGTNGSDAPAGISNWFREKIQNITPSASNTVTISNGGYIKATATAAHSWTFDTSGLNTNYATSWTLKLINGGVGAQTFNGVIWAGGTKPTLTSSGIDVLVFVNDGTHIIGSLGGADFK